MCLHPEDTLEVLFKFGCRMWLDWSISTMRKLVELAVYDGAEEGISSTLHVMTLTLTIAQ